MYLQINDGKALFASYLIRVRVTLDENQRLLLPGSQVEEEGIVCYSKEEMASVEEILSSNVIEFVTEEIPQDPDQIIKTEGIKYISRSEAIKHLQEDAEPESQIIPGLKKRNQELEATLASHQEKLKQTESALLTVMFNKKGG